MILELMDCGDLILLFGFPVYKVEVAELATNVRAQNAGGRLPWLLYPSLFQYIFVCMGLTHAEIVFGTNIELSVANLVLETNMCPFTELRMLYLV